MKKSVTKSGSRPGVRARRRLAVEALAVDPQTALWEIVIDVGVQVVHAMLEEDRRALCGPRYAHDAGRRASRAGTVPSRVVLGGRTIPIRRPRVRGEAGEVALPIFAALTHRDPLVQRMVEQMLVGVSTRQYARSLEPVPESLKSGGTSKSAVSRAFVARTRAQLDTWQSQPLGDLDLAALYLDGLRFGRDCLVVALGVDTTGRKHVLGLWDGSTENTAVCAGLLANLVARGLRTDRSVLVILDGSRALRRAVDDAWGRAAWVQRCHAHKLRNVLSYLHPSHQPAVRAALRRAYQQPDPAVAKRQLLALARQLEAQAPSAAASLREGLEETLTVLALPIGDTLRRALATTNSVENLVGGIRHLHRNVKRWRGRGMMLRWAVAGVIEAAKGFHRCRGSRDMRALTNALRARDERLGLTGAPHAA